MTSARRRATSSRAAAPAVRPRRASRATRWAPPARTPSRPGRTSASSTRRTTAPSKTSSSTSPGATTPGASTSTSACAASTGRSPSATRCAPTCRTCSRCRPTRPASRASGRTCTRPARRPSCACSRAAASPTSSAAGPAQRRYFEELFATDCIQEFTQVWWSVRPHHTLRHGRGAHLRRADRALADAWPSTRWRVGLVAHAGRHGRRGPCRCRCARRAGSKRTSGGRSATGSTASSSTGTAAREVPAPDAMRELVEWARAGRRGARPRRPSRRRRAPAAPRATAPSARAARSPREHRSTTCMPTRSRWPTRSSTTTGGDEHDDRRRDAGATRARGRPLTDQERAELYREQLKQLHVIDLVRDMMVTLVTVGYEKLGLTEQTRELRDLTRRPRRDRVAAAPDRGRRRRRRPRGRQPALDAGADAAQLRPGERRSARRPPRRATAGACRG